LPDFGSFSHFLQCDGGGVWVVELLLQDLCQEGVDTENVLQVFDLERGEIEVQELEEGEVETFG
jgi:hypothetical protein